MPCGCGFVSESRVRESLPKHGVLHVKHAAVSENTVRWQLFLILVKAKTHTGVVNHQDVVEVARSRRECDLTRDMRRTTTSVPIDGDLFIQREV